MLFLYNIVVYITEFILKIIAIFHPKIKSFVNGRKDVFSTLKAKISPTDKTIWFHAASLGEYEQGIPVIEAIKKKYPTHKIILTFFSPSGYEVRKNNTLADLTLYLPLDTKQHAKKFITLAHPEITFFIKYEFWLNYLNELKRNKIPTYLISGIFREKQMFFRWYGGFYRKALKAFTYFFVQNQASRKLINSIGFSNVAIAGDTRFDRVADIVSRDNTLEYIEEFQANKKTVVFGSTWPKDEVLIAEYINQAPNNLKFIIAPHNIKDDQILTLKNAISKKSVLFSERENQNLANYDVFIINTIGLLTKIYSYGSIGYVGGGFGNPGIHNILEPATFGLPVIIGPNFENFAEAVELVDRQGCMVISNFTDLKQNLDQLLFNDIYYKNKSEICKSYINEKQGATKIILDTIHLKKDIL